MTRIGKWISVLLLLPSLAYAEITDWPMQSTWVLDSKDKQEIMMGLTCCYRQELIDSVRLEHSLKSIKYSPRDKVRRSISTLQYSEPITNFQWWTFVTLQLLDIHSTYKGLQYDCVYEANPIMGNTPSPGKLFLTKTAILAPAIKHDLRNEDLTPKIINQLNYLMAIVVVNNYDVWSSSRNSRNCKKR